MSLHELEELRNQYRTLQSLILKIEDHIFHAQMYRSYRMPDMERSQYTEIKKDCFNIIDHARLLQGEVSGLWGKATDDYWGRKEVEK